jgi:hypothetical protein
LSLYIEALRRLPSLGILMKRSFLRELSGLSQFALAQQTGIPRMRISLSELGHLTLSTDEQNRIRRALLNAIDTRVKQLLSVVAQEQIADQQPDHHGETVDSTAETMQ